MYLEESKYCQKSLSTAEVLEIELRSHPSRADELTSAVLPEFRMAHPFWRAVSTVYLLRYRIPIPIYEGRIIWCCRV